MKQFYDQYSKAQPVTARFIENRKKDRGKKMNKRKLFAIVSLVEALILLGLLFRSAVLVFAGLWATTLMAFFPQTQATFVAMPEQVKWQIIMSFPIFFLCGIGFWLLEKFWLFKIADEYYLDFMKRWNK